MRRKASLVEESPEELYERVVQELEEENQSLYRERQRSSAQNVALISCLPNIESKGFGILREWPKFSVWSYEGSSYARLSDGT
jgi:hypothetical protein